MVICLERGADLHMFQLMPLPLTVSCFSKIQTGFSFLVPAHLGSPGERAVKRVCVCDSFKILLDEVLVWSSICLEHSATAISKPYHAGVIKISINKLFKTGNPAQIRVPICTVSQNKNKTLSFENQLTFGEVMGKSLVSCFF